MKKDFAAFIGGTFDDNGGKESKVAKIMFESMNSSGEVEFKLYMNGGSYETLEENLTRLVEYVSYVFWFANVPDNSKRKLVKEIKTINPKCILVTSKRNHGEYKIQDLIQHALSNKSNLFLEITQKDDIYVGRVLDPLGNLIHDYSSDFSDISLSILKRSKYLKEITRVGSVKVGDAIEVPNKYEFFNFVRSSADVFKKLIPVSSENSRFLGNASFRCRSGFPSFRHEDKIFVSRRNVDKENIGRDGFVALNPGKLPVEYYGEHKPSVDSPIHVGLYEQFPLINYMIHGHVYVLPDKVPMTRNNVPCGGIEEVEEILDVNNGDVRKFSKYNLFFCINLKGHGFIAGFANELFFNQLTEKEYKARIFPEKI